MPRRRRGEGATRHFSARCLPAAASRSCMHNAPGPQRIARLYIWCGRCGIFVVSYIYTLEPADLRGSFDLLLLPQCRSVFSAPLGGLVGGLPVPARLHWQSGTPHPAPTGMHSNLKFNWQCQFSLPKRLLPGSIFSSHAHVVLPTRRRVSWWGWWWLSRRRWRWLSRWRGPGRWPWA